MWHKLRWISELVILFLLLGWIIWTGIESLVEVYWRVAENQSRMDALWAVTRQLAMIVMVLLFWWGLGYVLNRIELWHIARVYTEQAGDRVLFREDAPQEPAVVVRGEHLFLFRGRKPDVLSRSRLSDCEIEETNDGLVLRVHDNNGQAWRYHWLLEEGQVDTPTLRQWIGDWLAGRVPEGHDQRIPVG